LALADAVERLQVLGDESRLRLCLLLRQHELRVVDLVRVTGLAQSRVSTHLARLREVGLVHDRREGAQVVYALATPALAASSKAALDEAAAGDDPLLAQDRRQLAELLRSSRDDGPDGAGDVERDYSPGRSWKSLSLGLVPLLQLGDVLDAGSGDGAVASMLAPACRTLTCVDTDADRVAAARKRLRRHAHVSVVQGDLAALTLPASASAFDTVLLLHTLTYADDPSAVLAGCARVLRPGGRLLLLCLDAHQEPDLASRFGERHPGFAPATVRRLLVKAGLDVVEVERICREPRRPFLPVVRGVAVRPGARGGGR